MRAAAGAGGGPVSSAAGFVPDVHQVNLRQRRRPDIGLEG